jgi:myo-inositol 2-dehydrogenase/D-chiro-inositol 1-dehydrogenase
MSGLVVLSGLMRRPLSSSRLLANCSVDSETCYRYLSRLHHPPAPVDSPKRCGSQRLLFSTQTPASSRRANVAVIGSGRMGQIRTQLIHANPKLQLVGIIDSNLSAAQTLAETYHVPAFDSLEQIIMEQKDDSTTSINGLVCCSPTLTHRPIVEQAIHYQLQQKNTGLSHIFLEKPVEESAPKIEALFGLASQHNLQLCCGFQRRFDPSYQSALEQLPTIVNTDSEDGGEVLVYANIFFGDHPVPPMEFLLQGGGDIFMDLSAHDVDYVLQALKGQSVVSVFATGTSSTSALQQAGVHDNATMMLTCSGGTVVTIFLSRSATYGYDQRAEFFGRGGRIQVGNIHETSTILSTNQGICHSKYQHSFPQRFHEAFGKEMDAFGDLLLGKEDSSNNKAGWPVTKEDCIRVQRVADAAQESARTSQVVQLL